MVEIYKCDPRKNTVCNRSGCAAGLCRATMCKEYAATDADGNLIHDTELEGIWNNPDGGANEQG